MPKGPRGSRGKSKGRRNPVRIGLRVLSAPKGTTRDQMRQLLLDSLDAEGYELPEGYEVEITWSNNRGKTTRADEWQNALIDSSTYGRGWDGLMRHYLTAYY